MALENGWWVSNGDVVVACPKCGEASTMPDDQITDEGEAGVLRCSVCGHRCDVKLKGWSKRQRRS